MEIIRVFKESKTGITFINRFYLLFLFVVIFIQCRNPQAERLASDPVVQNIFTDDEIDQLQNILLFFEAQVCEQAPDVPANKEECYKSFISDLNDAVELGEFRFDFNIEEQKTLFAGMEARFMEDTWYYSEGFVVSTMDSVRTLEFNYTSKYLQLLEEYGNTNLAAKQYVTRLKKAGLTPGTTFMIVEGKFDLRDIKARLIIAMHFLTINQNYWLINNS